MPHANHETRGLRLTLGAREVTLLLTGGNGTVDVALESSLGEVRDLVVGLDVLLDSLTAVRYGQHKLKHLKTKA
jgi:hypothetical protein